MSSEDLNSIKNETSKLKAPEKNWGNPIEFLMTCIGFSVGLGNVWRFPFLCFKNGGSAFVIAFAIMLFTIGLPLFFLEITIAQYSKFGPINVWKVVPIFRGLGIVSLLVATFISIYYNVLICWSVIYLISSFLPKLPWTDCNFEWNDEKCCVPSKTDVLNSTLQIGFCSKDTESPAKQYFNNYVLSLSDDIGNFTGVNWKLAVSLLACWLLVFLSLSKGVQSLGKVSYITAIFPYIMIIALIIRGVTLEGAMKGIKYYILNINTEKLKNLETWTDAASQVYFILGIAQGGLYTLGRYNNFNYNHQKTSIFIAILDGITGLLAGLAIFSVLGYMSTRTGIEVADLAVGGPGLSFIVYPEALSLMPFPWIWCIFFFLMMITIGFGSILSLTECVLDSITEALKTKINIHGKETLYRFGICMIFYIVAFPMATHSSLYIQNLIDSYLSGYPFVLFAFLEAFGLCWIYGIGNIKKDLKLMLGVEPNYYWIVCFAIVPVITFGIFIITIISNTEVTLNNYHYPGWAHAIGWIIVVIVLCPVPIFFAISIKNSVGKHGLPKNWKSLKLHFQPSEDWKPANECIEVFPMIKLNTENGKDNEAFYA
ncbi:unnamed protein product [Brachionus calyciflorus]|uniref:Uncharacterized protein n=1 Tax=Brachionus calyciflorus TaxID=104777 RepID=A0A813SCY8_9BILA|nr:unnamed protein product [Brachionus calyciflorus]